MIEDLSKYPRPDMVREIFQSLSGEWSFEYDLKNIGIKKRWYETLKFSKKIIVPFCIESEASGINQDNPPKIFWYSKEFNLDKKFLKGRVLLHFGAVDYYTKVYLNGIFLGEHEGGYTPFNFEIDKYLKEKNLLVVRVFDSRSPYQPRGKQTILKKPFLVFYKGVSGIWQDVWIESVGKTYLESFKVYTDFENKKINLSIFLKGDKGRGRIRIEITSPEGEVIKKEILFNKKKELEEINIDVLLGKFFLWSADEPNLYGLKFLIEKQGSIDEVKSYFGLRKIEIKDKKIYLNDNPLYQKLVLNQCYYPKGHYTPTNDLQFKEDILLIKKMGFNGMRVHQKIENKKILFFADYLGCLVWEEMPSAYLWSKKTKQRIKREWEEVIKRDFNHPSIIVWVPFNESWGVGLSFLPILCLNSAKEFVKEIYFKTKEVDSSRLVIDNSGYDHQETDILDIHHYLDDIKKCEKLYEKIKNPLNLKFCLPGPLPHPALILGSKYKNQPIIISEYGGFGFYRTKEKKSLLEQFSEYTELIKKQDIISGYCYTQFCDTFQEKNGLLDSHRKPKIDIDLIKSVNNKD